MKSKGKIMVTVKQFLDAGFELVLGDFLFAGEGCCGKHKFNSSDVEYILKRKDCYYDYVIAELAWRKNTGDQPVGDDCWIEVSYFDGEKDLGKAKSFFWRNEDNLTHWKPSLTHLEQQMNDNQEIKTALEMSERDIENYVDDCDIERELVESDEALWNGYGLPSVGIHCEYKMKHQPDTFFSKCFIVGLRNGAQTTSDEWLVFSDERDDLHQHHTTRGVYDFRPLETPEQKEARERDEEIKSIMKKWGHEDYEMCKNNIVYTVIKQMIDEGYRK